MFRGMLIVMNVNANVVLILFRLLGAGMVELSVHVSTNMKAALTGPEARLKVRNVD